MAAAGIGIPHDLPAVVDAIGITVVSAEGAEVLHGTAAVKEGVGGTAAGIGTSHDLPAIVDAIGATVQSAEGAEVGHGVFHSPPSVSACRQQKQSEPHERQPSHLKALFSTGMHTGATDHAVHGARLVQQCRTTAKCSTAGQASSGTPHPAISRVSHESKNLSTYDL